MAKVTPLVHQTAYRGRNDDGNETTATWKAAQSVNWTQRVGNVFRVRFQLEEEAGAIAKNVTYDLRYKVGAGAWTSVSTTSAKIRGVTSAHVADTTPTTQQMTGGTGTFQAGEVSADGITAAISIAAGGQTEVEYVVKIIGADTTNGELIDLQVWYGDGTALDGYTASPRITVDKPPPQPDTAVRVSFPTPTAALESTQTFRVQVRKKGTGDDPTARVELWEAGVLVSTVVAETAITSATGQVLSGTWSPTGRTAGSIEARVYGTGVVGGAVEVGAVAWDAKVLAGAVPSGSGTISSTGALTGTGESPAVAMAEGSGSISAASSLTGTGESPAVAVPEGSGTLAAGGSLSGTGESPVVAVAEGSGSLTAAAMLSGTGEAPTVAMPEGSGVVAATATLAGTGESPTATIPEGSGTISGASVLSGTGEAPPVPVAEGSGTVTTTATLDGVGEAPTVAMSEGLGNVTATAALSGTGETPALTIAEGSGVLSATSSMSGTGWTESLGYGSISATATLDGVAGIPGAEDLVDVVALLATRQAVVGLDAASQRTLALPAARLPEGVFAAALAEVVALVAARQTTTTLDADRDLTTVLVAGRALTVDLIEAARTLTQALAAARQTNLFAEAGAKRTEQLQAVRRARELMEATL